jgi:hypothetical protein
MEELRSAYKILVVENLKERLVIPNLRSGDRINMDFKK